MEENIISLFGKAAIKKRFFYDEKKYFLSTVSDKVNFSMNDPRKLDDEVNLLDFANSYINYYEEKGKHFIEHYSSLPNILKRMNELTLEGKVWQDRGVGILSGALDVQLRGLIISKLCNDNGLNDKILMCDEIFYRDQYKDWLPYYIKSALQSFGDTTFICQKQILQAYFKKKRMDNKIKCSLSKD